LFYFSSVHFISFHFISFHFISFHFISFQFSSFYCILRPCAHHFISEALKRVHGQTGDPVFAQHHTGAELLGCFSYVGVCQAPWWGKSPTLDPAMHEHIQCAEEEEQEAEEEDKVFTEA